MTRICIARLCLLGLALAAPACGGAQRTATPPTSTEQATLAGPSRPWDELSHDEKLAHMRDHVLPEMRQRFQAHDAEEFAGFGCTSCHGLSGASNGWAMPSAELPALYPSGTIGQQQAVDAHPEAVRFMFTNVTPTMQTLLGAPAFDEATGTGFTCFACHPHAAEDDPLNRAP